MGISTRVYMDRKAPNVFLMPGMFEEALQLLNDAREYFHLFGDDDQKRLDERLRTLYSCEMSRITLRLTSVMSWLMAQRAVFTGKISHEEALDHFGLEFPDVCMVDNRMLHGILPSYVCYLLDRSYELYERVSRLEQNGKVN